MPKQTVFERGQKLGQPRKQNIKRLFFIWREQKKIRDRIIRYLETFWNRRRKRWKKNART